MFVLSIAMGYYLNVSSAYWRIRRQDGMCARGDGDIHRPAVLISDAKVPRDSTCLFRSDHVIASASYTY